LRAFEYEREPVFIDEVFAPSLQDDVAANVTVDVREEVVVSQSHGVVVIL
jgi:hypothetical protein